MQTSVTHTCYHFFTDSAAQIHFLGQTENEMCQMKNFTHSYNSNSIITPFTNIVILLLKHVPLLLGETENRT